MSTSAQNQNQARLIAARERLLDDLNPFSKRARGLRAHRPVTGFSFAPSSHPAARGRKRRADDADTNLEPSRGGDEKRSKGEREEADWDTVMSDAPTTRVVKVVTWPRKKSGSGARTFVMPASPAHKREIAQDLLPKRVKSPDDLRKSTPSDFSPPPFQLQEKAFKARFRRAQDVVKRRAKALQPCPLSALFSRLSIC